ncbi:MAG: FAD-dependent oxidoreductase [Candidatus Izemoplasmatales bacterium]|jgi:CoA-disulfide reductase|nr:FAD-dependent oxidoreductase [Candidatus Izemoplasmatales bacterium]
MEKKKIIIIGGVAGGASTATRLRRMDEFAEIIMLERGEYISFANCGLPYYIGDVITSRDALLVQSVEEMQNNFNIDVRNFSEALKIDKEKKILKIKNLKTDEVYEETYDYLVISTGAFPVKPPITGINEAKTLFTLRSIPDMDNIKNYINTQKPKRATVIGAGFIGIEMAENLHHLGMKVSIVEMANQVMAPVDYEMAQIVHQHIKEKGVNLILSDGVKEFKNEGKEIILGSGKSLQTDLIIFAIGVRPENILAKEAGLKLGERGGIWVDQSLKTSDESIYAIGDAIEVKDFITNTETMIPLAGPANKQGRIAADNICGKKEIYKGSMGTSVAKVFDFTVGATGNNEKILKTKNIDYNVIHIHPGSHASYYPGASTISMKLIYNKQTEAILGAQAVGMEGVDKRIDVLSTAIRAGMKVTDLKDLELSYAPPFSSAKDPVNMLGFIAENIINGLVDTVQYNEIDDLIKNGAFVIDARDEIERSFSTISGSINIPYPDIRKRLNEIPKNQKIFVFCQTGIRAYNTVRILRQLGYDAYNLDGAFKTYQSIYNPNERLSHEEVSDDGRIVFEHKEEVKSFDLSKEPTLVIDASGLQCPGPIVKTFKSLETLNDGEILEITATDPGFKKDVKTWVEKTNNTLIDLTENNNRFTAKILKGAMKSTSKSTGLTAEAKDDSTIVVFSEDLDKAIAAFIIAQGAASMGKKVSLFFTFWGLNILRKPKKVKVKKSFIEKMFGSMMPRGPKKLPISKMNMLGMGPKMIKSIMKKKNVDSLQMMIESAMDLGVKITACAMSMDIMGIKKEELIDGVEIAGVATYLGDTTTSNHNLFI